MLPENREKCMRYSTVIGAILLQLPSGVFWYWGNMSVYSMSYFVSVLDTTANVDTPWVISAFLISWTVGTIISGFLITRIGLRMTILTGVLLADVSLFSGYFTNQHSVVALTFSMGVALGCGTGVLDGSSLQLIMGWAGDNVGTLSSLIQSSIAIGAVFINQFVTLYTNPTNLLPEMKLARGNYFTQKSILEKVPSMYLIIGTFSVVSHTVGLAILRPKAPDFSDKEELKSGTGYLSLEQTRHQERWPPLNSTVSTPDAPKSKTDSNPKSESSDTDCKECTPKQMLARPSFYVMWLSFFIGDVCFVLYANYYKIYGQLYIKDDHFLTNIGTTVVFLDIFSSVMWGLVMDKLGVKKCLVVFLTLLTLLFNWYFFTPLVDEWLFAVASVMIGCIGGSLFTCLTAATVILFGKTHLATNLGIMLTSSMTFNLLAPYLMHLILARVGWFVLFAVGAGSSFLNLILIICLLNV